MLPSVRNKATLSILDRLKQKGMPASMSPVGELGEEGMAMQDEELSAMGDVLRAPSSVPLPPQKKPLPKKKNLPEDEEVY